MVQFCRRSVETGRDWEYLGSSAHRGGDRMRRGLMPGEQNGLDERDEVLRTGGDVRLVVPASPEYLRLVRLTAAGMASRLGFTFDEVEDLRIAVDELCFHLLGDADVDDPSAATPTLELAYSA